MTAQQIVDLLNELLETDIQAIRHLFGNRVACNQAMADHPSVTVDGPGPNGPFTLGVLGLLEGIAGIDGKLIASVTSDEHYGAIVGFKLIDFAEVKREPVTYVPKGKE